MKKLKVGFNISPLKSGHKTRGMGYYTKNLLNELKRRDDIEIIEFFEEDLKERVDLIHYPFFDLYFHTLPRKKNYPTVITIGDVTPLVFPEHFPSGVKGAMRFFLQKLAIRNVKTIITFSDSSKADINKYLDVKNDMIFPISLGMDDSFKVIEDKVKKDKIKKKYNLPDKFLLFVGSPNWNKNILNLTEACLRTNIDLVIVGKEFTEYENIGHIEQQSYREFLEKYANNSRIHRLGFIDDRELPFVYNLSTALLLPSFYEGFGLPILEAQACGIPVITSNISSMPEVAGEGALLVDPHSVKDITEAIKKMIINQTLKNDLIKKGFENIKKFSWKKAADETVQIYSKIRR